jgi:hypothetical protein
MNTGKHKEGKSTCLDKKGLLYDQTLIKIEQQHSVLDFRKFYMHLNDTRKSFKPAVAYVELYERPTAD